MYLQRYTVQEGRHNFRPMLAPIPRRGVKGFAVEFSLSSSCWYDIRHVGDHWNKLLGITRAFTWNDHDACMGAWRPMPEPGLFSVAGYVNWPGKKKAWRVLGEVEAGERQRVECWFINGQAKFFMGDMVAALDFCPPKLGREVGMYFGGRPKAPHWMEIQAGIEFFR